MKIYLIHGRALVSINNKVRQLKESFSGLEITEFSGRQNTFFQILPDISTGGLFSEKRLVILEEFNDIEAGKLPEEENLTLILKFLKTLPANTKLYKDLKEKKVEIVELSEKDEVSIFPFLDKLAEKNQSALKELDLFLDSFGGQYVLTMLTFLLRRFILIPKNLPQFVVQKIQRQSKYFTLERIEELYKEVLETDYKIKSGLINEKIGVTLLVQKFLK